MNSMQHFEDRQTQVLRYLDENPFFSQWTLADKQRLAATVREFHLSAGECLIEQGAPDQWMYRIISGSFKGVILAEEGNEAIIDVAAKGRWFSGLGILDKRPSMHSIVALEDSDCIGFDGAVVEAVVKENPALYREVAYLLCEHLRALFMRVEASLLWPIQDQILIRLRNAALEAGTPHEDGHIIRSRISQDVLAAMLGVTRQTLNKELGELKQAGLVRKVGALYWVNTRAP